MSSVKFVAVVVNYKTPDLLEEFIESYREFVDAKDTALIVVDVEGDLSRPTYSRTAFSGGYYPMAFLTNVGYARACNAGAAMAANLYPAHEYIGFFNSDVKFLDRNCVPSCLDLLESNSDIAAVGPLQINSDNKITHAGIFGTQSNPQHRGWKQVDQGQYSDVRDAVTLSGSALFIDRGAWEEMTECGQYKNACSLIYFDTALGAFLPTQHYYEETFFMYHLHVHGFRTVYNGEAKMIHEWHKSSEVGSDVDVKLAKESQEEFRKACDIHGIERN